VKCLQVTLRKRTKHLPWDEITRAGLVHFADPDIDPSMPTEILPGLGKLISINRAIAARQRQLVLARGSSMRRVFRIPIPVDDPGAASLVETVQQRLGERWVGEMSIADHGKVLGVRNPWWFYPLLVVGLVAFGYMVLFAIGAFDALISAELTEVPAVAWLALVAWLLLFGWIWLHYRRMR
jgi:hypothetical protein